ncbi:MAG: TIGR04076 family protein [Oscillospiraceae bacterium]|jgi:uncharacterized repeat protein (TIGR04076 family)|nr:TIGR04076 family protein [Oscillospiraceae bacterium]
MKSVKITVLERAFYPELADAYLTEGRSVGPCPLLNTGDTFIYRGSAEMPPGFCPWAWIDIYRGVSALSAGASMTPWNRQEGLQILCCTDGVRPVIFKIEACDA